MSKFIQYYFELIENLKTKQCNLRENPYQLVYLVSKILFVFLSLCYYPNCSRLKPLLAVMVEGCNKHTK